MPTASLTPHYLDILKQLYPPPIQYTTKNTTHCHNTRQRTTSNDILPELSKGTIIKTLRRLKRGTASGPFSTSIDVFKDYALYTTTRETTTTYPYLDAFCSLITLIAQNKIPSAVKPYLAAQYVVALHKDPQNLNKLRPIGIGTALRRITAASLMTQLGTTIAETLLPHGQLGIAISGGLDFICHSTQAQLETFMLTPQTSSRALVCLDIENMFNAISRQACRQQLSLNPHLQPLLPFFDLLYSNPNTCWHKSPLTHFDNFLQWEGFAQGCPLSGAFADIVLATILQPLNQQLQERLQQRNEPFPPPTTLSYHDDTSAVLPYEDIPWFLDTFQTLGNPIGIRLNLQKTTILTSLSAESPLPYLQQHQQQSLTQAFTMLGPQAEHRHGIRLLGQPIGSSTFTSQFIDHKLAELQNTVTNKLFHRISDHQTQLALVKHCVLPSIQHLLATHVYHHFVSDMPTTLHDWNSTATLQIRLLIHNIFTNITKQTDIPLHATPIIHLPALLGGIGIRDPIATAIPAALTTFTRTLRYCKLGIPCTARPIPVSPIHQYCLSSSTHKTILTHYSSSLLPALPLSKQPSFDEFLETYPLRGLQQHLYHQHQQTIRTTFTIHSTPDIAAILPSLLSPLTSIPMLSLSRRIATNRINNTHFRLLLQRKLRLPVLPPHLHYTPCTCRAHTPLDPFGDHFFSCTGASKTPIHNLIRNTCFHILSKLAPMANLSTTTTDVQLEPPNLTPTFPTLRPADIGIQLHSTTTSSIIDDTAPYLALDVTFTHTPPLATPLSSDQPVPTHSTFKVHDDSAKQKFNVPHAYALHAHNIILLPITIDHLGGLGPFATSFFFGTHTTATITASAPFPNWSPQSFPNNPDAYFLYQRTLSHCPKNILSRATQNWQAGIQTSRPFGSTYHTATPSQWAIQTLGLNLIKGLAHHCQNAIQKLIHHEQSRRPIYKQLAQTSSPYPTHALLRVSDPCHFPPETTITTPLSTGTSETDQAYLQ
jgi:hypothetical protein